MKIRTRSVIIGILSAFLLTGVSLNQSYAEATPSRIWGRADVYIGYGSKIKVTEDGKMLLICQLYNLDGKLLDKKEDGVSGTATFDLSNFPTMVTGTFNLSGSGRDLEVDLPATENVLAGISDENMDGMPDGLLQESTEGRYMLVAGEHKCSDGSTLIHRCKIEVLKGGGFFCHYNVYMIVKNIA